MDDEVHAEQIQPPAIPAKVLLVGASRSGKTSIARMMCSGRMSARYHSTVGIDTYQKDIRVQTEAAAVDQPSTLVQLTIWDMAGESDIQTLRESFFKDAVAGILVFASDDRQSYLSVRSLKEAAEKEARRSGVGRGTSIEWTLVQHKVDLLNSAATDLEREATNKELEQHLARDLVSAAEGRHLADALGGLQVFQTTTMQLDTLSHPFVALASAVYYRQLDERATAGVSNSIGATEPAASHPSAGLRFRDNAGPSAPAGEFDGDELFLSIAGNPDAPTNQPFKLHKPAAQGSDGTRKFKEEFKAEIYTFICLALSFAIFVLTFYIILPAEGVEVDPIEKIGEVTEREAG